MKRIMGLILSLVLVVSSLAGCSQNGQKMLENMEKASEVKIFDRNLEFEYIVHLKNILDVAENMTRGLETSGPKLKNEKQKIFKDLIEKNPDLKIKISADSYINSSDKSKLVLDSDAKLTVELMGLNRTFDVKIISDGKNLFVSTAFLKDVKEYILDFVKMTTSEEEYRKISEAFDEEFIIPSEEYMYMPMGKIQEKPAFTTSNTVDAESAEYIMDVLNEIDIDKNISNNNGVYKVKFTFEEFLDEFILILEKFNEDGDKGSKIIGLSKEELEKLIDTLKNESGMMRLMLTGSEFEYANSYKNNEFSDAVSIKAKVYSKDMLEINAKSTTKQSSDKKFMVPNVKNSLNLMELVEDKYSDKLSVDDFPFVEDEKPVAEQVVYYNPQTILLDGKKLQLEAYNIDEYNYVMLRDLAKVLNATDKKFYPDFDGNTKSIVIQTNKNYDNKDVFKNQAQEIKLSDNEFPVYIDGQMVIMESYSINGYTYFKLRDLGTALNFVVDYDAQNHIVIIKTK